MSDLIYKPPETLRKFITHFVPSELFFDFAEGPVGSGKTTANFFKLAYMAKLQAPSPQDGLRRSRAVIVRQTFPQLNDTTIPSWNYWFKDGQAGTWAATQKKFMLRFADVECEVLFRALDTPDDVARVLSLETTFAILDEFVQIDRAIVDALSGRCGRYPPTKDGGATNWGMWGVSNADTEDNWWYKALYEELSENWTLFKQPSGFSVDAENIENLPGKQQYYHNLAKGKPREWVRQFIECEWGFSLAGTPVVPTFNPELHIAKEVITASKFLPLIIGFDPGVQSALIVGQLDLDGRLNVVDEIVLKDYGAERLCTNKLLPLLRTKYPDFTVIIAPDPAANSRNQTDEKSVVDVLKRHHLTVKFPDMNNQLQPRLDAIEHFTTRLTTAGPALRVSPHCRHLIRALAGGWRYRVDTRGKRSPEPEKNEHSHPADGFSYLCRYYHKLEFGKSRETVAEQWMKRGRGRNTYAVR